MKSSYDKFLEHIEHNKVNPINALPTGLEKFDEFTFGTRQGCYYLYGAETGVGKTKFVRDKHIHVPYDYVKKINDPEKVDIMVIDFSLEIGKNENIANAVSRRLYLQDGIVYPATSIMSWNGIITDRIHEKVKEYSDYFDDFYKNCIIIEDDVSPTLYHDVLFEFYKRNGKFEDEGPTIGKSGRYIPDNPNLYVIAVLDTINIAETEGTQVIKQTIDRISRCGVHFRNKCNTTIVNIQQFNAEISATDRSRYGIKTPLLRDFEDSKRPTKDANIVCGLFDPVRHMRDDEIMFGGYDMLQLNSWFRSLHLLKNRNGISNKFIPMKFHGGPGYFSTLPPTRYETS